MAAPAKQENGSAAAEEKPENVKTIKAYKNPEFLTSPIARHIRIMCELQEPMKRMADTGIENYVQIIGSHLLMHPEERTAQLTKLKKQIQGGGPRDEIEALQAKLRFDTSLQKLDQYYIMAMELGEKIARWSEERGRQGKPTYHVCTGGGPGAMEAANRGARQGGAMTLGFSSTRPEWGGLNSYVSEEGAFQFHYFFMRKFWAAYKCMAFIALPGGYGSLDELFEILNLISSKKIVHRLPIILVGSDHWKKAINWDYLVESAMISQQQLDLISFKDTAEDAFSYLIGELQQGEDSNETVVVENAKRRRLGKQNSDNSTKGD